MEGQLGSGRFREHEEILTWFGDWELIGPGLTSLADWQPLSLTHPVTRDPIYQTFAGGVARKAGG